MSRITVVFCVVAILAFLVVSGAFTSLTFTGMIIYSSSSSGTVATNEGTNFSVNGTRVNTYKQTWSYNGIYESIYENATSLSLKYNYDFNSTYNITQPSQMVVNVDGMLYSNQEALNISLLNWITGGWDYINQTAKSGGYQNITTTLSWDTKNLSNYINSTTGQIKLLFEDINESSDLNQEYMKIDYIAINVTSSPLTDEMIAISNSSGTTDFSQQNYTRYNYTREDMLWVGTQWNASNVTNGTVRLNVSTNSAGYNYTEWYLGNITANWTYANLTLSNTTMFPTGGNVTVTFTANDSFYQYNTSHITMYFGLFSNASVTAMAVNETGNVISSTPVKVYCRVADTYSNVPVAGYNVSFYNNSNLFGYANTNSTGWASAVYGGTAAGTNYYLNCSIGNQTGQWYYNSSAWNQTTMMNVVTDTTPPNIDALWMDSAGVNGSYRTNLYMNASINLNATDSQTAIASGTFNMTSPDGATYTGAMRLANGNLTYVFADNETGLALNKTGNYTVNITATDIAGNKNISGNLTFNVTSNYSIVLDGYSQDIVFNRGENLTFEARDENGVVVAGSNITANLTYPTNTVSNWYTGVNNTLGLALNGTLNVSNYTMKLYVNKSMGGNNTAYGEFRFNVTDVLQVNFFINPSNSYTPSVAEDIGTAGRVRVYVNNTRGGRFPYNVGWTNLTCYGGGTHNLSKDATNEWYTNSTMNCYAPNAYSTSFALSVTVNDTTTNNTGSGTLTMTTASAPGGGLPGGGGPGGGGGGVITKNCSCEWVSSDVCGLGSCQPSEVLQRWVCNPAGCKLPDGMNATTKCQPSPSFCELNRRGFNFTVSRDSLNVKRGENATLIGTISNTGNLTLEINMTVQNGCCSSFVPGSVVVQNLSSLDVPITVHAALMDPAGSYIFTVNATSSGLESDKSFTVNVVENQLNTELDGYKAALEKLKADIASYAESGIDVSSLQGIYAQLENSISSASSSSAADDLSSFTAQVDSVKAQLEQAQTELTSAGPLKFVLDNKYWLMAAALAALILLYLVTQITVPYMKLTREIKRMVDKEQSQVEGRKATYKDYFMGKVDEKAFEEMIIGKQSEILSTKGSLRHKIDERNSLVKQKLSPKAMKDWIVSGFGLRKVAAKLASRLVHKLKRRAKGG